MSVKKIITKTLNILFPVKCVCCKKISEKSSGEDILCESCKIKLRQDAAFDCKKCGSPPFKCRCRKIKNIDEIVFPYFYSGDNLRKSIYSVKKSNLYYINEFFAKDMYNSLKLCDKINIGEIDIITSTPRMKSSVRLYGYNQTAVLAKIIAEYIGVKYIPVLQASKLYAKEQKSLTQNQRVLNVANKFVVVNQIKKNKSIIKDKNILVIDDVVTTGSTLSECARIMKNTGANKIYALCAASVFKH